MKVDDDLAAMSHDDLLAEVMRCRALINHRLERVRLGLIEVHAHQAESVEQQAVVLETLRAADAAMERLMVSVRAWPWLCLFAGVVGVAVGLAVGVWL